MKKFKTLDELNDYIIKQAEKVLREKVAEEIKDIQSIFVESEVYDKYKPNDGKPYVYKRRGAEGGLADTDNMKNDVEKPDRNSVKLTIKNITKGDDGKIQIADLVEGGDGTNGKEYEHKRNRDTDSPSYLKSRRFQGETVGYLNSSKEHIGYFESGMRDLGFTIKKR